MNFPTKIYEGERWTLIETYRATAGFVGVWQLWGCGVLRYETLKHKFRLVPGSRDARLVEIISPFYQSGSMDGFFIAKSV